MTIGTAVVSNVDVSLNSRISTQRRRLTSEAQPSSSKNNMAITYTAGATEGLKVWSFVV